MSLGEGRDPIKTGLKPQIQQCLRSERPTPPPGWPCTASCNTCERFCFALVSDSSFLFLPQRDKQGQRGWAWGLPEPRCTDVQTTRCNKTDSDFLHIIKSPGNQELAIARRDKEVGDKRRRRSKTHYVHVPTPLINVIMYCKYVLIKVNKSQV